MCRKLATPRSIPYRACITASPFPDPLMAAVAKITCNEMSNRVTSEAIQLHGGVGFTAEHAVSRVPRGARAGTHGRRTTEERHHLTGQRSMGAGGARPELVGCDPHDGRRSPGER